MTTPMTRDNVCISLANLYGYDPYGFDGMTLAEICDDISLAELYAVCDQLGVS